MWEKLEVLVGVVVVALALTAATTLGFNHEAVVSTVRNIVPDASGGEPTAAESGITGATDDGGGDVGDEAGAEAHTVGAQENPDCIIVLRDDAQSYIVLQEHINDPDKPEGGRAGNQNAFDKQCQGSLDGPDQGAPTEAPGNSENAPGQVGNPPSTAGSDEPGKSEDAPGQPSAPGQPQGQGQENADANGNGPGQNPGQAPESAPANGQGSGPPANPGQGGGQGSSPPANPGQGGGQGIRP